VAELIPLFPLNHVLLPGMPLPLHIFEQRYRDLLGDVADAPGGASFGVVVLRSGTETRSRRAAGRDFDTDSDRDSDRDSRRDSDSDSGVADVADVGTVAEILELETRPDGTADLLAVGSRRFAIDRLVADGKRYLRAEVRFLPEPDGSLAGGQDIRARELLGLYDAILLRLAGRATGTELPEDPNQLSYQIAARLPLPPEERQALLSDDTTSDRLARLAGLLRREIALLQGTRSIAVSPAVLRLAAGLN
jgi:Lon protease-like protein